MNAKKVSKDPDDNKQNKKPKLTAHELERKKE